MNATARIRTTLIIAVLSLNAFLLTSCRFGVSLYLLIHVDLSHAALNAVSVALMTCIAAPLGGIIVGYASVLAWGNLNSSLFIMIAAGVILVSTGIALWIIQTRKQTYPSMLTKDYWTPSTWVKRFKASDK